MARFAVVAAIVALLAVTAAAQAPGAAPVPAPKMAPLPAPPARSPATAPAPVATPPTAAPPSPTLVAAATNLLPARLLSAPEPKKGRGREMTEVDKKLDGIGIVPISPNSSGT
jgi:hypothetical protein